MTWFRLTNGQRAALVNLPIWTTEEDRLRALTHADDAHALDVQAAICAVQTGLPMPANLGVILAIARYEDAGWMPYRNFDQWRRWTGGPLEAECLPVSELVQWMEDYEEGMRRKNERPREIE